jgi:hypothetical protein
MPRPARGMNLASLIGMRYKPSRLLFILAKTILVVGLLAVAQICAYAATINQYASSVIGFSSQYRPVNWSASQALGAPNVFAYGENPRAWAPLPMDGSPNEWISLGFTTPVFATGLTIRETLGTGFVYQVEFLDKAGVWHVAWSGVDPSPRIRYVDRPTAKPAEFLVPFTQTPYKVAGVKIKVNTNTTPGVWEEIDSVKIVGIVPEASSWILLAIGLLGVAGYKLGHKA